MAGVDIRIPGAPFVEGERTLEVSRVIAEEWDRQQALLASRFTDFRRSDNVEDRRGQSEREAYSDIVQQVYDLASERKLPKPKKILSLLPLPASQLAVEAGYNDIGK